MKKLSILLSSLIFISCHSSLVVKGKVIDKNSKQPIESAEIISLGADTAFSDTGGVFLIAETVFGLLPDRIPVLIKKENYEPVYAEVDKTNPKNLLIELEYIETQFIPTFSFKWVSVFYEIQFYMYLVLYIITYLALIFTKWIKGKRKFLWFILLTFFHVSFFISCIDGAIMIPRISFSPTFLIHYWTYPYTIKIIFPIGLILF